MDEQTEKIIELNLTLSKAIYEMQRKEIIERLKPFYDRFWEVYMKSNKKIPRRIRIQKLEKEMNNTVGLNKKLKFFYSKFGVGIGAENYLDRKVFPLIHDSEFEKFE